MLIKNLFKKANPQQFKKLTGTSFRTFTVDAKQKNESTSIGYRFHEIYVKELERLQKSFVIFLFKSKILLVLT